MRRALAILMLCVPRLAAADVSATPTSVTCPPTVVNTESGTASVTLTRLSGPNNATLSISNCSGAGAGTFNFPTDVSLPATVDITYTPTAAGSRTCIITATNDSGGDATITVTGSGTVPAMITVTTPTAFAAVRVLDTAVAPHTSTRTVTVQNTGGSTLTITNVTFTGDFSLDPSSPNGTTTSIASGNAKSWTLRFDPSAPGTRVGSVTFHNSASGTAAVNLSGDGTTGLYTISPTNNGDFGVVVAGTASGLDIGVTHTGAIPRGTLTFSTVTLTNASMPWFSITAQPNTLTGGTTAGTITVRCSPPSGATATATATVNISADADAMTTYTQNVSCTGGASQLALDVSTIDMDPTLVGTTSASKTLVLLNTGTTAANVGFSSTSVNGSRFSVSGPAGCGVGANNCSVPPSNGMITITMTFSPTLEATVSASFSVNGAGAAPSFIVTGRGIDRHIVLPEAVQFADTFRNPGSRATVAPVTLRNDGEHTIAISALQIGGGSDWSVVDPMPTMVPGLGTADIMVRFAPTEAGKADDGQLLILNDDNKVANGMPIVILSGNGLSRNVDVTPMAIDFGDRAVGIPTRLSIAQSDIALELANNDSADFTIREMKLEGAEAQAVVEIPGGGSVAGTPIVAGDRRPLDLVITATQAGEIVGNLALYLDEDPIPQAIVVVRMNAVSVDIHGGGGCSTGAGAGPLVALVLFVLTWLTADRRPRDRRP